MPVGVPEILVVVIVALLWFIPIAAGVWVLMTLRALQKGQAAIESRLAEIERRLRN